MAISATAFRLHGTFFLILCILICINHFFAAVS